MSQKVTPNGWWSGQHSAIFVVSGPSGSGKETAINYLMNTHGVDRVVTLTTRKIREGEVPGEQYEFVDDAEFVRRGIDGRLLEFNRTYGSDVYASPSSLLVEGDVPSECVLEMDPQGYVELKTKSRRKVVGIFLIPPSLAILHDRITSRASVSNLDARLQVVSSQFVFSTLYEYCVVNDAIDDLKKTLDAIVLVERARSIGLHLADDLLTEARRREYQRLLEADV